MNNTIFRKTLKRFWDSAGAVSVRTKIFGIVLGSTLLLSFGFLLQTRLALQSVLEQKSQEQAISIAHDLAARSTDIILVNDLYALHQLLEEAESSFSDVGYAFIIDDQGFVLAHTFSGGFPVELLDLNLVEENAHHNLLEIHTDEGIIWDVAVPIFSGKAGTARVGISSRSMRETLTRLTTQLGLTVIGVLGVSLGAATLLTWILTRPILELVSATTAVGSGDFSVRVERWADDEIGALAEAFNLMIAELSRTDEIRVERENLRLQLIKGMISTQEEERKRISRELHDSTSQSLTSLKMGLRSLEMACDKPELHAQANDLRQVLDQTLEEIHNLAVELRPMALDDLGLEAGLRHYVEDWRKRHNLHLDIILHLGNKRLPETVETALYRSIQEALTNISRHAEAQTVSLLIERRQREILTVIEDDGKGFDQHATYQQPHLGLLGIRERAELLGGSLTVESMPGRGTSIFINIPLSLIEKEDEE